MNIESIEFIGSSPSLSACPRRELPEFAFIGRSNVGKSSLINMIAGRKGLAKVSSTPGKTRLINHFAVKMSPGAGDKKAGIRLADWYLVDLPGYGFARLSKVQRSQFEGMIRTYLEKRENLALTFVLIDARLEPQKIDLAFMDWLGDKEIPFVILFTKTDKLARNQLAVNILQYNKTLSVSWAELPAMISTSAVTKEGRLQVLETIASVVAGG